MKKSTMNFFGYLIFIFLAVFHASRIGQIYGILTAVAIFTVIVVVRRDAFYTFAARLNYAKNHERSFELFEKAYKTKYMPPSNALMYAYLLLRDGHIDRSEQIINNTLRIYKRKLSPADVMPAHLNKALILWKRGELSRAIEKVQAMYDTGYKTTALYGVLGYFLIEDGQLDRALAINTEAVDFSPDDKIIADNYAINLFLVGDTEAAVENYEKIIAGEPNFIEPYYNFGRILAENGEKDRAVQMFEKALLCEEKFLSTVTHAEIRKALKQEGGK